MTVYLDVEDLLGIVRKLGVGPVRDVGLLDSAAHRPATSISGFEPYPDLPTKAAALLHSLVSNHALGDGNKRLAWAATAVFLDVNGAQITMSDPEVFDLVMTAAAGELTVEAIGDAIAAGLVLPVAERPTDPA